MSMKFASAKTRDTLLARADAIVRTAREQDRDLTDAEQDEFDAISATVDHLNQPTRLTSPSPSTNLPSNSGWANYPRFACYGEDQPELWRDVKSGRVLPALSHRHKLSALYGEELRNVAPNAIGRLVQSALTGKADNAGDLQAAMGTTPNYSGGYLVPEILDARFIDAVRSKIVLSQAGAKSIPLLGDTTIARIATDPTFAIAGENENVIETTIAFDSVLFVPRKVAALVYASRELMEDAPNAAQVIETAMSNGLAAAIDSQALCGTGASSTLIGCMNLLGAMTTDANVGSIATSQYDEVIDAHEDVLTANGVPTAIISTPATKAIYEKLRTGDGTNAGRNYLSVPDPIRSLPWLTTTGAVAGEVYVGAFDTVLLGIRQGALIEFSKDAGNAFAKHQVAVKITMRIDVNAEHASLLAKLQGVTA